MDDKLWFRSKRLGWGWVPSSIQGWAVILIYVLAIAVTSHQFQKNRTILATALTIETIALLGICYLKGEKIPFLPKK